MGLYFRNNTPGTIWVAYGYHAPGCEGGVNWAKKGWWQIGPGGTAKVRSGWVGGSKFFFFAESDSGATWAGEFTTHLPDNSFDWCWNTGSTSGQVRGMRKITPSIESMDHTVALGF